MREWGDPDRRLGPSAGPESVGASPGGEPSGGGPSGGGPSGGGPSGGGPSGGASPGGLEAEDEFEPRFCVRCRKRISVLLSERQDACDECLAALEAMARGLAPGAMPPDPGEMPPCPNCGGHAVEREWRTDWITRAVDVAADVAAFFIRYDRHGRPLDAGSDVGPVRVMHYHCLQCEERWKPRR